METRNEQSLLDCPTPTCSGTASAATVAWDSESLCSETVQPSSSDKAKWQNSSCSILGQRFTALSLLKFIEMMPE